MSMQAPKHPAPPSRAPSASSDSMAPRPPSETHAPAERTGVNELPPPNPRQTGPRMKMPSIDPELLEAPPADLHPSVMPESLRKPFASLTPQKRESAPSSSDGTVARDKATAPRDTRPAPLADTASRPARAICKTHKIAKGKDNRCLLCAKEEAAKSSGRSWKLLLALGTLAVVAGAAAALLN